MTATGIRLYQTGEHPCGYWPERTARDVLLDPHAPALNEQYAQMLQLGFRRSGSNIYRPYCENCRACVPVRLEATRYQPTRSQRRCEKRNADLQWQLAAAGYTDERYALYQRYLSGRHAGGGMDESSSADFRHFLFADWSPTHFLEARLAGRLLAVAVTDVLPDALSAVYTYFDPAFSARSLGTAAIIQQLRWAKRSGRPHVYLGFWIAGHPKMDYKAGFAPAQMLAAGRWQPLER
jgi:leucyl-tRNA---protein transferase